MREGWIAASLGDVCDFQRGLTYSKTDEVEISKNAVLRANNIDLATEKLDLTEIRYISDKIDVPSSKKVKKDSIIICTASGSKSHLGKVAFIDDSYDYAFGGFMGQITAKKDINPRYLFHVLTSSDYKNFLTKLADGVNINNLKFSDLQAFPLAVPPLSEQQNIVAILDEAFAGLATATANAERNLKNARELFESYLNSVFAQASEAWTVCPLADCVEFITYGFTNPMPSTDIGPWMVTAKNVVGGEIEYSSARHTSREAFDNLLTDKSRPQIGDVLLTKDGTLGRLAVVDRNEICINQSVALLRPNARMRAHFMRHLLSSRDYQKRMIGDADGATIKHIYITRVDKMDVAFPLSVAEQEEIVARLDMASQISQELEIAYTRKLAALNELRQSILQKAFSGNLTSPPSQTIREAAE